MKKCGYSSKFRGEVLKSAKTAYGKIFNKHLNENTPLYRNRSELDEVKSSRQSSAYDWWKKSFNVGKTKKEHTAVLFVPPTPHGGLAKALRKREAELNSQSEMSIRIIEKGGIKMKSILTQSDPFPSTNCDILDCPYCQPNDLLEVDPKQSCKSHNIGYSISCNLCDMKYEGESHRRISVRGSEHVKALRKGEKNSPLYKHLVNHHPNGGCKFKLKITGKFQDAFTRQADESTRIQTIAHLCMNSKSEFNAPPIKRICITDA